MADLLSFSRSEWRRLSSPLWPTKRVVDFGLVLAFVAALLPSAVRASTSGPAPTLAPIPPVRWQHYPQPRPFKNRPPIPARIVPAEVVEPPRTVPAQEWRSPYCTFWSDGETQCVRRKADGQLDAAGPAVCEPLAPEQRRKSPTPPHPIACSVADQSVLERVCHQYRLHDPGVPTSYIGGSIHQRRGVTVRKTWVWQRGKWKAEGNSVAGSRADTHMTLINRGLLREDVPDLRTYYCFKPYTPGQRPWSGHG
jgi:hypothetical protein